MLVFQMGHFNLIGRAFVPHLYILLIFYNILKADYGRDKINLKICNFRRIILKMFFYKLQDIVSKFSIDFLKCYESDTKSLQNSNSRASRGEMHKNTFEIFLLYLFFNF